jgi:HSP20 family protein
MTLIRWNPTSELMNLHSEMDRIFNDMWQGTGLAPRATGAQAAGFLPLDIERTENAILVHAPVPGFTPEEVSVTVDAGVLTIEAQHQQQAEHKEKNWIRQERFSGRLYRQIALGEGVNADQAQASFQNGVLTVTLPLTQRPEPKKVPVVVEASGQQSSGQQSGQPAAAAQS